MVSAQAGLERWMGDPCGSGIAQDMVAGNTHPATVRREGIPFGPAFCLMASCIQERERRLCAGFVDAG